MENELKVNIYILWTYTQNTTHYTVLCYIHRVYTRTPHAAAGTHTQQHNNMHTIQYTYTSTHIYRQEHCNNDWLPFENLCVSGEKETKNRRSKLINHFHFRFRWVVYSRLFFFCSFLFFSCARFYLTVAFVALFAFLCCRCCCCCYASFSHSLVRYSAFGPSVFLVSLSRAHVASFAFIFSHIIFVDTLSSCSVIA